MRKVGLFLAALLGLVAAAAYLVLPNVAPAAPAAPASLPASPSAQAGVQIEPGWQVFADPQSGFSFSYPPGAVLESDSNELHPYLFIRVVFKDPAQASLIVDVRANRAKGTPAQFAAQIYQESAGQPAPKTILEAGQQALVGRASGEKYVIPPTLTDYMIFLPRSDRMLIIYPGRSTDSVSGTRPALDLFNKVLGTFTFTGNE